MMQTIARPGSSAQETRRRILTAAKEIYEAKGTRGTTTREVADRAGVNEATLFRHFGNKSSLLMAMREYNCGIDEFNSVMDSLSGNVEADLLVVARSLVKRMRDQKKMMCISMAEAALGEVETASIPEWRGPREIRLRAAQYFSDHIVGGRMRGDAEQHARAFMSMLFAYVVAEKLWVGSPGEDHDLPYLVHLFLNGAQS